MDIGNEWLGYALILVKIVLAGETG